MEVKVSIVIASHLSDVAIEMNHNQTLALYRLNFVKYLVFKYPNTDVEIDVNKVFDDFKETMK